MKLSLKIYTILMFLLGLLFLNFTVDDAFITFRYAKNLVEYGVWNWNPSIHEVVEAYTSPIFAFLSIAPLLVNFSPTIFFKILAVFMIYLTYRVLVNNLIGFDRWLSAAFIVTNILIFPHAFSGLETIPFFLAAFYLMTIDQNQINKPMASWLIFLAPLIRPEGALLSIYIIFQQLIIRRRLMCHALAAIGLGVIYFLARYYYFGFVLPNTYYAKIGSSYHTFVTNVIGESDVIFVWIIAIILIKRNDGKIMLPLILALGYVLFILPANLQMNYGHRFAWHMLLPAIFYAFWISIRRNEIALNNRSVTLPILFSIACLINITDIRGFVYEGPYLTRSHKAIGMMLAKYKDSDPILAVGDAGLIPYYSGLNTIDFLGLANVEIAQSIRTKRSPILVKPDIFIVYSNEENSCDMKNTLTPNAVGELATRQSIEGADYSCMPGPRYGFAFYMNFLVDKSFARYNELAQDIQIVKNSSMFDSPTTGALKDAVIFVGLKL